MVARTNGSASSLRLFWSRNVKKANSYHSLKAPMNTYFSKSDLPFLADAMDAKHLPATGRMLAAAIGDAPADSGVGAADKVTGAMSVPQPVTVDVNGTMTPDDYKACSMVMAVCQNMVQKTLTDAAKNAGVEAAVALKDMNSWVQAYVDFPFPFFSFKDTQSDVYHKDDFSITADPDVVATG